MKESMLLIISLITSVIGLIALFFISISIGTPSLSLDEISAQTEEEMVTVQGEIKKITDADSVTLLIVEQPTQRTAVLFKPKGSKTNLEEGMRVELLGKVDMYEGKPELIVHKARIID